jgi:hypothetical protein
VDVIRYHFDLYPRDDPKDGARLVRFTKLQSAEYRGEANGTGAGRFSIRADTAEAQNIDPAGLQYIRVVREDTIAVTELVVGGFFLDTGDFSALDEKGTRLLVFGGAGTLSYLARAIMWSHTYISSAGYTGQDPFDSIWRLDKQWDTIGISGDVATGPSLGGMLWRVIYEAQHFTPGSHKHADGITVSDTHDDDRTENPLPALTTSFDWTRDSNNNLFANFDAEFHAQVGENVLAVVKRLMEAGLYVSMHPDTFALNAYPAATHRRDRTGGAWGTNVVRFQAPTDGTIATGNIKSDAKRAITAHIKRSALLAGGQDIYGLSTGTSDIPWEGFYPSDAAVPAALEGVATVQLGARDDAGDTLRLRGKLGHDPSNGKYKPFETAGVLLDDLATVHSGSTQWDYDEQTFPIAAATVVLRPGGDWDVFYDLGSSYSSMAERRFQVTPVASHTHPPNPQLCPPTVPGSDATIVLDWTWSDWSGGTGFNNYFQDVAAYPSISQAAHRMGNGTNNTQPNVRSGASGGFIPNDFDDGGSATYLPCTVGTSISLTFDLSQRISGAGTRRLRVFWYTSAGAFISDDTLHDDVGAGVLHQTHVLTPPATAERWRIHLVGRLDNVLATTGSGTEAQNPYNGTSPRAARCDHAHTAEDHDHDDDYAPIAHGHRADEVNVVDAGGYFTGTDVEADLQEIGTGVGGGGVTDHGDLTGLSDDDHPQYLTDTGGAKETVNTVAAAGASETLDLALGNWQDVTLTEACSISLSGFTTGVGCSMLLLLRPAGFTVTWPPEIAWPGGIEPDLTGVELIAISLVSDDGGAMVLGSYSGAPAAPSGGGGGSSSLPLTAVVDGEPVLLWDENNSLIAS